MDKVIDTVKQTPIDEDLESVLPRTFIIALQSKPGLRPGLQQAVVVTATSIRKAKQAAVNKVAKKKFAQRKDIRMWQFTSIEEYKDEPSDSEGTGRPDSGNS